MSDYYLVKLQCGQCRASKTATVCLHKKRNYIFIGCKNCEITEEIFLPASMGVKTSIFRPPLSIHVEKTY